MITKILITLAVLIGVAIVFRSKPRTGTRLAERTVTKSDGDAGKPSKIVYTLASGLIVVAVVVFYIKWQQDHRIVNIRVFDGGDNINYQAYSKDVKGNSFTTIDGRNVVVGENQRIETTID